MAAVTRYESPPSYSVSMGFRSDSGSIPHDRTDKSSSHHCRPHKSPRHRRRPSLTTDPIDRLDHSFGIGFEYHHEGPFDCASRARNSGPMAPIDALARTNALALSAVPPAKIADAVNNSRPIDGVAVPDQSNVQYEAEDINVLEEFQNPMIAGRWPGEDFATAGTNQRESSESNHERRKSISSIRTSSSTSSGRRRSWGFRKRNDSVEVVESLI
ncbi:hypothetical protein V1517DRAFT_315054 [Lipomyces orientalis]|uniref:Uncharacterized protein n=1 Tax=Lipomyces orientalis TaxID=1233043 RepID=A0ACC3TW24_9ASCO